MGIYALKAHFVRAAPNKYPTNEGYYDVKYIESVLVTERIGGLWPVNSDHR